MTTFPCLGENHLSNCIASPQGSMQGMALFGVSNVNSGDWINPTSLQRISKDDEVTLQDDDAVDLTIYFYM